MNRERIEELLVDYLYDELDRGERRAFEEALADHPDLQAEVDGDLRLRGMLADLADPPAPQPALDAIVRAARHAVAETAATPTLWERFALWLMQPAVGTAMLFLIVAGTGLYLSDQTPLGDHDSAVRRAVEGGQPVATASADRPSGAALGAEAKAVAEAEELDEDADQAGAPADPAAAAPDAPALAQLARPTPEAMEVALNAEGAGRGSAGLDAAKPAPGRAPAAKAKAEARPRVKRKPSLNKAKLAWKDAAATKSPKRKGKSKKRGGKVKFDLEGQLDLGNDEVAVARPAAKPRPAYRTRGLSGGSTASAPAPAPKPSAAPSGPSRVEIDDALAGDTPQTAAGGPPAAPAPVREADAAPPRPAEADKKSAEKADDKREAEPERSAKSSPKLDEDEEQTKPAEVGKKLHAKFVKQLASGDFAAAEKTLNRLAALPLWKKKAAQERKRLAAKRVASDKKKAVATKPAKAAPAKKAAKKAAKKNAPPSPQKTAAPATDEALK